ncbi:innexin inx1 [Copidosoma floridanum]|uniref:innexin inx1 n=1 Tax=Copidosoma floridanum TaxID=29053 RepID=UPI0006C954B3|nr:innexin inx1 [Copidosoma floridanum]XP_014215318.1 innexin inx1 [Copidosoma floridanum]
MLKLLGELKGYLKPQEISTDSMVFRLHNQFTSVLLLACSLIITASQFVGNPISCITPASLPSQPVNTFCWITSTFTMPDAFNREVGLEVAHPGVTNDFGNVKARKYYTYYQWVCFALFFQAICCYFPNWLWSIWEGGLIRTLVTGLHHTLEQEETLCKKKNVVMEYLITHIRTHNAYVYRYYACEVICLFNILVQLFFMNKFFDGEFITYGWRVLSFTDAPQEERFDPMVYIFPRVTKCIFHKFGPSGTIQNLDSLCVLPLNIVNEKTYIFIWFWFLALTTMLVGLIIYRAAIIFVPSVRPKILQMSSRMLEYETCQSISRKIELGDWWVLYVLSSNMDSLIYRELLQELTKRMSEHISPVSP